MVRWQVSQEAVVGTWFAGLAARALVPLWQLAQVPGATPVWLKVAGIHAVVRWQVSQDAVVGDVVRGLAAGAGAVVAARRRCPASTPVWLNVAGVHAVVRWQVSHDAVVGTWFAVLPRAVVPLWQLAQVPGGRRRCG